MADTGSSICKGLKPGRGRLGPGAVWLEGRGVALRIKQRPDVKGFLAILLHERYEEV